MSKQCKIITIQKEMGDFVELFGEKNYYKEKIIEMVEKISNPAILNYIYIIVSDVVKEDKKDE